MSRDRTFVLDIGWRALLKDLGLRSDRLLRRAELPADLLARAEVGLSTDEYFRFWRALDLEIGDPCFPIRIVEAVSTESFDPPLFAALCSANLLQASQRLAKYKQLMAPMRLEVQVGPRGDLTLAPSWLDAKGNVPSTLEVAELAFLVKLARIATRERVMATRVTLPRLPDAGHSQVFAQYFGVVVRRGTQPSISFSAADARLPFLTTNDAMWRTFEPDLRRRLNELEQTATTADRVSALLLELLPSNAATVDMVAERLAISKRTLQRRLEEEGENFRALVNRTRESLARHYLTQTAMTGGEIAFLLGFEDPNSFYRAFHDWTGKSPEAIRNAARLN